MGAVDEMMADVASASDNAIESSVTSTHLADEAIESSVTSTHLADDSERWQMRAGWMRYMSMRQ